MCAGGAGEIAGALMECFIGHERKGEGFFGVSGNAEGGGGKNFYAGTERGGELRHQKRIFCAAAGDDELMNFYFGEDESVERVNDGERGEDGGGADEIGGLGAMFFAESEDIFQVGVAVVFAAGGFGRREFEIGIAHQVVDKSWDGATGLGDSGVFVEGMLAAGKVSDERVNEHVGGAGVEGEHLLGL